MDELRFDRELRKGAKGKAVRRVQEWLRLRGYGLVPDGDFGPATEFAVEMFQKDEGSIVSGVVDQELFETLTMPMRTATGEITPEPTLGETVVACAKRHLQMTPREIGGQNNGPWVRLYMAGHEGASWPWCAGFACYVLRQACDSTGSRMPIQASFSCDSLAASAKQNGRFLAGTSLDRSMLRPGMLFLNRRTATDWTHVGIVTDCSPDVFLTIEGNTNDDGGREGYEVSRRIRGYAGKDFISVD